MRKGLKIAVAIILLFFFSLIGFLEYRAYSANKAIIPGETSSLIKINADQIIKSIALNVPANLRYYSKSSKKKKDSKSKSTFDLPIKLPAAIFLYSLQGHDPTTYFSRLAISDYDAFVSFISSYAGLQKFSTVIPEVQWAKSDDGKFTICYNTQAVAFSYSTEKEDVEKVLPEILSQANFIPVRESSFKELTEKKDHIIFTGNEITGVLNFRNGAIDAEINWLTDKIIPAVKQAYHIMKQDATAVFWLNADLQNIPGKLFSFKDFTVHTDSLLKYYNGYMDFEWGDVTKQTDTIITYEYNDDFEKVETLSVQEKEIPSFQFSMKADTKELLNYLHKENLLDTNTMLVNNKAFPLYTLHVFETKQQLTIGTNLKNTADNRKVPTDDFMHLSLNFKKLKADYKLPFISGWLSNLDDLEVTGKATSQKSILIKGKIRFVNKRINSFYQLSDN